MGMRSQIYIRYQRKLNNGNVETRLIANYYSWNFGERMISRARHSIGWIKKIFEKDALGYKWKHLRSLLDVNFDMKDIQFHGNIEEEYEDFCKDDEDFGTKDSVNNMIFFCQCNNNGKLFIDIQEDTIKYCFLDSEAENEIRELIKDNDFSEYLSVDISKKVKEDGFEIVRIDMPLETTGYLLVNESSKIIAVNTTFTNPDNEPNIVLKKSRLITAHEFGHYILHGADKSYINEHRDTERNGDLKELEADYFARSILMPYDNFKSSLSILQKMFPKNDKKVIEVLTKIFDCTINKVKLRIADMKELESIM